MSYTSLRAFLRDLERDRALVRVRAEVDADLEAPAIAIRALREGGPALLFENVRGSSFPLLMNLFGTRGRVERALGIPPAALGEALRAAVDRLVPPTPSRVLRAARTARPLVPRLLAMRTHRSLFPPGRTAVAPPDLRRLPVVTCWPGDAGRFLTYPLVITASPRTGSPNVGVYRMQQRGPAETGMHIQIERGAGGHYAEAEARGEPLPCAVVVGADPALLIAAIAPLPEGVDELAFSGFLRGRPLPVVRSEVTGLNVPAAAEILLEGSIPPSERAEEGPFGDHFGHYSAAAPFPVFRIERMTARAGAVYHASVVGKPPQEDQALGDAVQEISAPMLGLLHPEVRAVWAYYEAGFHNLLAVSVRERYAREGLKAAFGLLGRGQLSLSKVVVLVGPDVDPRDPRAVLRAIRAHFDPAADTHLFAETALDTLDFTSFRLHQGSKLVIDAIARRRVDGGDYGAGRAPSASGHAPLAPAVRERLELAALKAVAPAIRRARLVEDALLVVTVPMGAAGRPTLEALLAALPEDSVPLLAVVSDDVDVENRVELIWGITTRFDAARDVLFSRVALAGAVPVYHGILGVDATWKTGYPEPLVTSEEIARRVEQRWREYFPAA